jgi:hypothetical protein
MPPLDLSCDGVEREPHDLAIRPQDGEVIDQTALTMTEPRLQGLAAARRRARCAQSGRRLHHEFPGYGLTRFPGREAGGRLGGHNRPPSEKRDEPYEQDRRQAAQEDWHRLQHRGRAVNTA